MNELGTRWFSSWPMRRYLLVLVLAVLLPMLVVQGINHYQRFRARQSEEFAADLELARDAALRFEGYIQMVLVQERAVGTELFLMEPHTTADTRRFLAFIAKACPLTRDLIVTTPEGRVLASTSSGAAGAWVADRDYLRPIVEEKTEWVVGDLRRDEKDGGRIFPVAHGIRTADGELKGIVLAVVDLGRITYFHRSRLHDGRTTIMIFDRAGALVYVDPPGRYEQERRRGQARELLWRQAGAGREAAGMIKSPEDAEEQFLALVPIGEMGWVAGVGRSRSEVMSPVMRQLRQSLELATGVTLLSVLAALWIASRITRRLAGLGQHVQAVGHGDFSTTIPVAGIRELDDVALSFDQMARDLEGQTQEARHRANELDVIFDTILLPVVTFDEEGALVKVNRVAQELYGFDIGEYEGEACIERLAMRYPDGRPVSPEDLPFLRALRGEPVINERFIFKDNEGRDVVIVGSAAPIRQDGVVKGVVTVWQDVTERERLLADLAESEERFRQLAENVNAIFWIASADWRRTIYISPAYERIFGRSSEAVYQDALAWLEGLVAEDRARLEAELAKQRAGDYTRIGDLEFRVMQPDGSIRWVLARAFPVRDAEGKVYRIAGVSEDITERKQAEEALKRAHDDLERRVQSRTAELTRSNADLEQFAYVASHDLQEPLRMVASYVQLLEMKYQDSLDEEGRDYMGYAIEGARRMQNLIRDLLEFSRVKTQAQPFHPVNCEMVLDQVVQNLEMSIRESGARIARDPLPTILADETQLIQVFQNLIDNATKFRRADQPPEVHVSAWEADGEWLFSVRDNGIGIEPKHFDRIFVIFQRLHGRREKYVGTGIGLAIVKRIVERHGGRIWIESVPGQGSTFYFTIPFTPPTTT